MLLRLDPRSGKPLYHQLSGALRRAIRDGEAATGDQLPPAREMARSLGVNMHTVLRAYQQLRDEGLIELRRGRGAVIREGAAVDAGLATLVAELAAEASRHGVTSEEVVEMIREEMS